MKGRKPTLSDNNVLADKLDKERELLSASQVAHAGRGCTVPVSPGLSANVGTDKRGPFLASALGNRRLTSFFLSFSLRPVH